jgi:hypothetical protein
MIGAAIPPRAATCLLAAWTSEKHNRLILTAMKMPSGIAETNSQNDPHWIAQLCSATKAVAIAESCGTWKAALTLVPPAIIKAM